MARTALSDQYPRQKIDEQVMKAQRPKTLNEIKILIVRPDDDEKLSVNDQKIFWSGIRVHLYLVKHSRLNVATAT